MKVESTRARLIREGVIRPATKPTSHASGVASRRREFRAQPALVEPVLSDDYPVFCGYLYVCDDRVVTSDIEGTVRELKKHVNCKEVRRCDILGRARKGE